MIPEIITAMIVNSEQVVIEKRGVDTNTQLIELIEQEDVYAGK